ncbi:MAG: YbfB/YjiJ family MFS transporter, partial [Gammaproteobacteria bacterium]|nr:YbfB/YjiJ family MFS transporter [Gammaproteobacteria bacterium]
IAIYPVSIAEQFGTRASPRIYGQVFTAWGLAGLVGPWVSGWLFDATGSYRWSLLIAALLSLMSCGIVRQLARAADLRR